MPCRNLYCEMRSRARPQENSECTTLRSAFLLALINLGFEHFSPPTSGNCRFSLSTMPRGRPKGSKNKPKTEGDVKNVEETTMSSSQVSAEKNPQVEEPKDNDDDEVWDLIQVLSRKDGCTCRMEGCKEVAVATWATNLDPEDKWNLCETCQEDDFGGWPEGVDPPDEDVDPDDEQEEKVVDAEDEADNEEKPKTDTSDAPVQPKTVSQSQESSKDDGSNSTTDPMVVDEPQESTEAPNDTGQNPSTASPTKTAVSPVDADKTDAPFKIAASPDDNGASEEAIDDQDEVWDLKKILPIEAVSEDCPILCSTEDCNLVACCVWISNQAPTTKWYACLDCQEDDFEGWPPADELPLRHMTEEHKCAIASKSSRQKSPAMPQLPTSSSSLSCTPGKQADGMAHFVTPPPSHSLATTDAIKGKDDSKHPPKANNKPPSANALAAHKKWQEEATKRGGKDVRIVVSKPVAKQLIFDALFNSFCPMNITQIYEELKAVVPKAVLSACLQDMVLDKIDSGNPFADSDDEEEKTEGGKPSSEPFAGALLFKAGKNQATNIYYTDHSKLTRMDRDQREELANAIANARAEEDGLKESLKKTLADATQLLSEPTNEEAATRLEAFEAQALELEESLEAARKLKVNESHKKQTKRSIDNMVGHWRKRKRQCMNFLVQMEESSDGTVSAKKCLAGDGQIALDSDEAVAKAAVRLAKDQRARALSGGGKSKGRPKMARTLKGKGGSGTESLADPSFVGVRLNSHHNKVERIYVDDEE